MCWGSRAVFGSIRARLTVWLALLVTLCLAAFAVYLYVAVGRILTANLDQALRVQAHQIAATYDFDVLEPDDDQVENQQRVDTMVGGQGTTSRVWAEVLDTQGHILTRSSNLGSRHVPLPAPAGALVRAAPRLSTQAVRGGALHVYSLPARHEGHIVGLVVVAVRFDKAATTTPAAVGRILTADLDQALRVQAHQIAATYDFDVLEPDDDQAENQQRVDTIVGGQGATSRVWAEVLDTQGHIVTSSGNLGSRHVPLPAPAARLVDAPPHLSTQAVPGGVLHVYSLPVRHEGHIVGVVVVAALRNKALATTPAAVGHILTADLDQALRVQAHQIAAVYDFDILQPDLEQVENQQRVDTSVGGQSAASRVWAEVFDTRGHVLTRSSNLGPQHVPLPAPAGALVHAPPHLSTQAAPGGALHVYSWPAIDDDGKTGGLVVVAAPLDKVRATMRLLLGLLVAGGLGLLLLAVLSGGVLVRRGLRPLEEMASVAEGITTRRLDQRMALRPRDARGPRDDPGRGGAHGAAGGQPALAGARRRTTP
jgi:hypothetical protein